MTVAVSSVDTLVAEYGGGGTVTARSECRPGELPEPCDCGVGGVEEQDVASAVGDPDVTTTLTVAGSWWHGMLSLTELPVLYTSGTQLEDKEGDEAIAKSREADSATESKSADDATISPNSECSDAATSDAAITG